jgi:hypothetical protein
MTTALNGYSAKLTGAALEAVLSDPNVDYLSENSVIHIDRGSSRSQTNGIAIHSLADSVIPTAGPDTSPLTVHSDSYS